MLSKQMLSDGKTRERRGLEDGAWSFTCFYTLSDGSQSSI